MTLGACYDFQRTQLSLLILEFFAVPSELAQSFSATLMAYEHCLALARYLESPISFVVAGVGYRTDRAPSPVQLM
jgi:hypothetical protein